MIADQYNDPKWMPFSNVYPDLHDDYSVSICLDIEDLPIPTSGDVCRTKLTESRYKVIQMMTNYDESGKGDGSAADEENSVIEYVEASRKQAFMLNDSNLTHSLYLWEYFDEIQLLKSVKAFLPDELKLGDGRAPLTSKGETSAHKRQRQREEVEDQHNFRKNFSGTFENLVNTQDRLATSQDKLANSQEALAEVGKSDNIVRVADALAETEIKLEDAIAEGDEKREKIYRRKMEIIKQQIVKMGGTIPE